MRSAYRWLMLPLLTACAAGAPQWDKPGASQAALDEDEQKCRVEARLAPQPHLEGPTARTSGTALVDREQERGAQEEQRIRQCMQDKGYSLKR